MNLGKYCIVGGQLPFIKKFTGRDSQDLTLSTM